MEASLFSLSVPAARLHDLVGTAAHMPPETDGISPDTSLNARAMMAKETFKYPPLQYLTVDWLTPRIAEKGMTPAQILEHRSARLEAMRWITASQELLTAFLVLFFALRILLLPLLPSLCAALSFLLLPLSLFYSQTTNMDMPCAFWFFASITCAVYAEYFAERKKIYLPLSLMTGILIGCAFCTKDQLYAAYLLPAAAFAVWKLRRHKQVVPALMPFFPWLAGFLISTASIYLLIGKETFLPHFKWITGTGSDASYAMSPTPFPGIAGSFCSSSRISGQLSTGRSCCFFSSRFCCSSENRLLSKRIKRYCRYRSSLC